MSRQSPSILAFLLTAASVISAGCDASGAEAGDGREKIKDSAAASGQAQSGEKPITKRQDDVAPKVVAEKPEPKPKKPVPTAVPNAGALIKSASLELDSPGKMIPVHAKVRGVVGTLQEDYNNIYLHVVCDIGGARYAEIERELNAKSGEAFEMDDKLFGGVYWGSEGPLGDCDAWLSIRESLGSSQHRESLIAAACRRDEAWSTEGCPGLPEVEAPQPIGEAPAEVTMVKGRPYDVLKAWGIKALIDYQVNQHIHPDYELGATIRCTAGKESREYWDRTPSISLSDIQPGERARGFVMIRSKDDGMAEKPERCELETAIRHRRDKKDLHPLQTFCWTPEEVTAGACGAT